MSLLAPIAPAAALAPRDAEALSFLLAGAASGPGETAALAPEPEILLGRDERAAVLMALRDSRASLSGGRWRTRFARIAFGLRRPAAFASGRLEALRRYAAFYRFEGAALPFEEEERLRAAGLSGRHAAAARALVDAYYRPDRARPRIPWTLVVLVALAAAFSSLFYRWLAAQFGDSSGAFVVTTLLATWAVSIAAVTGHPRRG
ncbi:MAG TPA: hypothetical protein VFW19_06935 [Allosphingosinicella sp.]|nr:hypothetical protein [Allosphingosinicella sp.]